MPDAQEPALAPEPPAPGPKPSLLLAPFRWFLRRAFSGLVILLPVILTGFLVYQLYELFRSWMLPAILQFFQWVSRLTGAEPSEFLGLPPTLAKIVLAAISCLLVLVLLFLTGVFFRGRAFLILDHFMNKVPLVDLVYRATRDLFQSIERQSRSSGTPFKRVVIVEFPHPGMRVPALVTNTIQDEETGEPILCVCVLTGVLPPNGFTLLVPERMTQPSPLSVNEVMQAILSGGVTLPGTINYHGRIDREREANPHPDALPEPRESPTDSEPGTSAP